MHIAEERLYFLTARGKPFYHELINRKSVALLGLSRYKETIRLNGIPQLIAADQQSKWLDIIFEENPYMKNVYPGDTRNVLEVFYIEDGIIEYFNLGVHPIFRESYAIGNFKQHEKLYRITDACIKCGICTGICPQNCIEQGEPFFIKQKHCLRCGACKEKCSVGAIEYR